MNRKDLTMRDMALAMGVLVAVVLAFVALYGGFSFSPGGPDTSDAVAPTADVQGGFSRTDRNLEFAAVVPQGIPTDWHASSWSTTLPSNAEGRPATARGGWLNPDGQFITLIQSSGEPAELLTSEFTTTGTMVGTVEAGGATWDITTGVRDEVAWIRQSDGVTLLITGTAPESDFRALADAVA